MFGIKSKLPSFHSNRRGKPVVTNTHYIDKKKIAMQREKERAFLFQVRQLFNSFGLHVIEIKTPIAGITSFTDDTIEILYSELGKPLTTIYHIPNISVGMSEFVTMKIIENLLKENVLIRHVGCEHPKSQQIIQSRMHL